MFPPTAELAARLVVLTNETVRPEDIITTEVVPVAPASVPVLAVSVVFVVLTTLWTALRLYVGKSRGRPLQIEDYLAVVSLISFYGLAVCSFLIVYIGGSGHHILTLQPYHITRLSKVTFGIQVLYAVCLGSVKVGIAFMLKRIFVVREFKIAAWITMALCLAWAIFTIVLGLTICQPVAMNWDPTIPGGFCGNQMAGFAAVGIFDLATDLILLVLPIPMVWRLQMRMPHKIALLAIFGAGALTMVFGALRLYYVLTLDFLDVTYSQVNVVLFSMLEPAIAVVVSSSVLLKPIFDSMFRRFFSLGGNTSNQAKNASGGSLGPSAVNRSRSGAGTDFKNKSRTRASGFSQMHEDDDELELDSFRKHGHNVVVERAWSVEKVGGRVTDHEKTGSAGSRAGSEEALQVRVVNTLDVSRS